GDGATLGLCHFLPHPRLTLFTLNRALQRRAGYDAGVVAEGHALRARHPAAMLHAERFERLRPGLRREREVRHDRSVLLAALDDVAGLQEEPLVGSVLDLQLVDLRAVPAGRGSLLTHRDGARRKSFVES